MTDISCMTQFNKVDWPMLCALIECIEWVTNWQSDVLTVTYWQWRTEWWTDSDELTEWRSDREELSATNWQRDELRERNWQREELTNYYWIYLYIYLYLQRVLELEPFFMNLYKTVIWLVGLVGMELIKLLSPIVTSYQVSSVSDEKTWYYSI